MTSPASRSPSKLTHVAACLPLLALTACRSDPRPYSGRADPVAAPENNPRILLSQPSLMKSLGFDAPIVSRPDGLLTVAVPTRSLGEERYILDYRFVWYDAEGYEVRPAMSWKEIVLEPKEQRRLQANALDTKAQDWKIEIRWANR